MVQSDRVLRLEFLRCGQTFDARLLVHEAPLTCAAVYEALSQPHESECFHAMWSGAEVFCYLSPVTSPPPLENHSTRPKPGDLVWFYMPSGAIQSYGWTPQTQARSEICEVAFVYGECDFRHMVDVAGWRGNIFAKVDDLDAWQAANWDVYRRGVASVRLSIVPA